MKTKRTTTGRKLGLAASVLIALVGFSAGGANLVIVNETFDPPKLDPLFGWEGYVDNLVREYVSDGVGHSTAVRMSATLGPVEDHGTWAATTLIQNGVISGNDWATRPNSVLSFDLKVDRPDMQNVVVLLESLGGYVFDFSTPYTVSRGIVPLGHYTPGVFRSVVVALDDPLWVPDPYNNPDLPLFDPSGHTYQISLQVDQDCLPALGDFAVTVDNVKISTQNGMIPWKGTATTGMFTWTYLGDVFVPISFVEEGVAENIGHYTQTITFTPEGIGNVLITAANEDTLIGLSYIATETDYAVRIVDGTGRFKGAVGSFSGKVTWADETFTSFTATTTGAISTVGSNK